jgi:hypothetical protein
MKKLNLSLTNTEFHNLCQLADGKGKNRTVDKKKLQALLSDHSVLYRFADEYGTVIFDGVKE